MLILVGCLAMLGVCAMLHAWFYSMGITDIELITMQRYGVSWRSHMNDDDVQEGVRFIKLLATGGFCIFAVVIAGMFVYFTFLR